MIKPNQIGWKWSMPSVLGTDFLSVPPTPTTTTNQVPRQMSKDEARLGFELLSALALKLESSFLALDS